MATFIYSPTERVTIHPTGDVSVTDGATTVTYSKIGANKTITRVPPDPYPPVPETPVSLKQKPNGDVIHTYSDITKTPPVTVRITYRGTGDIEILTTIGQNRHMVEFNATTGVRRTKTWMDPDPEPQNWGRTDLPKGAGAPSSSNGSKKGKSRPSKKPRGSKPAKRRPSKPKPKKKSKKRR